MKKSVLAYENSEGADQPFHYLDDIKYLVSISKI